MKCIWVDLKVDKHFYTSLNELYLTDYMWKQPETDMKNQYKSFYKASVLQCENDPVYTNDSSSTLLFTNSNISF